MWDVVNKTSQSWTKRLNINQTFFGLAGWRQNQIIRSYSSLFLLCTMYSCTAYAQASVTIVNIVGLELNTQTNNFQQFFGGHVKQIQPSLRTSWRRLAKRMTRPWRSGFYQGSHAMPRRNIIYFVSHIICYRSIAYLVQLRIMTQMVELKANMKGLYRNADYTCNGCGVKPTMEDQAMC